MLLEKRVARTTSPWFCSGWPNKLPILLTILLVFGPVQAESAGVLRVRTLDGEGQVYGMGTRVSHPVTVQVTDETGKPVAGASVSFQLPDDGPGGAFTGGMHTDIAITAADGKASAAGILWDRTPGPVSLRVTAAKDQMRAGAIVSMYVSDAQVSSAKTQAGGHRKGKWLTIGLVVGGAAATGLALGWARSSGASSNAAPDTPTSPAVQVGTPSISIGRP